MRLPEDKSSNRTERSYAIEQDVGEEGEEEDHHHDDEDKSETSMSDSVMATNGRSSNTKEISKIQLEFDR